MVFSNSLLACLAAIPPSAGDVSSGIVVPPPPPTEARPVHDVLHGETIVDPFRWLEPLESESEEVRVWTDDQNDYTRNILDNLPGRAELESRLSTLMHMDAYGLPRQRGPYTFYTHRRGDQDQAVLYVERDDDDEPRVLLDPNELDEAGLYSLDFYEPSHDGRLLAFGLSYAGDEMTVCYVMNVETGIWRADEIPGKARGVYWLPDSSGFLYSRLEDPDDAYSRIICMHELGTHWRQDPILFRQTEPSRVPWAGLSEDGRWVFVGLSEGWRRNDLWIVDADHWMRTGEFNKTPVAVDLPARFTPQHIHGDTLYLTTTYNAPNGKAYAIDLNRVGEMPGREHWRVFLDERDDAVLGGLSMARGVLVASYQRDVVDRFERFRLDGTPMGEFELPGLGSASISTYHDRTEAFIRYTSFNEPPSIYRVDMRRGDRELFARPDVDADIDQIAVQQRWYESKDGTRVPMFIVHRRDLELDGDRPTLLAGYGGFNISRRPSFNSTVFPWLEAGAVYVVANIRGGGEFGDEWHRAGQLESKQNVFDDFIVAAEFLIEAGYTNPDRLAIQGGSNGGLLTGAVMVQRPDLFAAVISQVPLLDMLRYHEFLMARFWVPEYGSAEDPEQFEWLRAYSPYHNLEEGVRYPATFITAGENDNRVHPLHARKMAAAMQQLMETVDDPNPVLLWVDRAAGHGAGKPLRLRIRDSADIWSFVMWQTGMWWDD